MFGLIDGEDAENMGMGDLFDHDEVDIIGPATIAGASGEVWNRRWVYEDECLLLVEQLQEMEYDEAAEWITDSAWWCWTFSDSYNLLECFDWNEAPQGYTYWENIYYELVEFGWEPLPDERKPAEEIEDDYYEEE